MTALFERLTPQQWSAPTDCPGWDVRAMAGHMLGMAQMAASIPEMVRQQMASGKRQKRDGGLSIDALTAVQVEKNAGLSTGELVDAMRRTGPRRPPVRRRRKPALVRNRTMPEEQDVAGHKEPWTFGYLFDVILTRDPFMHRIDIARPQGSRWSPQRTTRGASSTTWCANGPLVTVSPMHSSCRVPQVVGGVAATTAHRSRWTRSSSAGFSPDACRARGCCPFKFRSERVSCIA